MTAPIRSCLILSFRCCYCQGQSTFLRYYMVSKTERHTCQWLSMTLPTCTGSFRAYKFANPPAFNSRSNCSSKSKIWITLLCAFFFIVFQYRHIKRNFMTIDSLMISIDCTHQNLWSSLLYTDLLCQGCCSFCLQEDHLCSAALHVLLPMPYSSILFDIWAVSGREGWFWIKQEEWHTAEQWSDGLRRWANKKINEIFSLCHSFISYTCVLLYLLLTSPAEGYSCGLYMG